MSAAAGKWDNLESTYEGSYTYYSLTVLAEETVSYAKYKLIQEDNLKFKKTDLNKKTQFLNFFTVATTRTLPDTR